MAKRTLNTGLEDVLLDEAPVEENNADESKRLKFKGTRQIRDARLIPIDKIKPDPNQPRKTFEQNSLKELTDSIKEKGVIQPITVEYIEKRDYFKIISGERRYRASQLAGLAHMPCIVRTTNENERLALQLIENIQREDLSPIDKARGLLELKSKLGKEATWQKIEVATGISESRRKQFLSLLNLPEQIQNEIVSIGRKPSKNQVTEKHARALKRLNKFSDKQLELFKKIKNSKKSITGDEADRLAKEYLGSKIARKYRVSLEDETLEGLIAKLEAKLMELKKEEEKLIKGVT